MLKCSKLPIDEGMGLKHRGCVVTDEMAQQWFYQLA